MMPSGLSPLSLDVVPMQLPDINPVDSELLSVATDAVAAGAPDHVALLLHPGTPSELLIRLRNETDHALQFTLALSGHIPPDWCLTAEEPYELPPGGRQDVAIAFQVPADFFETLTAALPGQRRPLNYGGRLDVYSHNLAGELEGITSEAIAVRVRPDSLYVKLLPQIYQEVDLVGRLMAIVERTFRPDVDTWNALWAYLDPRIAPQAMLGFLAHWVGWHQLPQLTWDQQRRLIHRAVELYRWRGTVYGLRLYLHLATGLPLDDDDTLESQRHISIVEPSRHGAVFDQSAMTETTVFGGGQGFHFVVVLRPPPTLTVDESLARTVIDQARPAFCTYELYITGS
jgi:phage tail-like protein